MTSQGHMTRPTGCSGFHNNSLNSSDLGNRPTCFKWGEQGHWRIDCRVFCTHCRTQNHDRKSYRKHHNSVSSLTNSHITAGYHPTVTPPPLMETAVTTQQAHQTGAHNNSPLFQNLFKNNQPRTSTMIHTPFNGTSPAPSANMMRGLTQIITQVANSNKKDEVSKQMMKNIKIFNGSNKAEYITWLSQVEAAARFTNTPFREAICQRMAPAI